ncbi:hypothetical protein PVAP13_2NG269703 [Panicum virgatum]|uniref:Uncharacterized protein n=1 Tax=Panicum virgatum TaxID=38727 RepID=A0A8T0VJ78_PANVG|nr:hypothetical protein PVAP13_2NG269703 [Panicum virgatum]
MDPRHRAASVGGPTPDPCHLPRVRIRRPRHPRSQLENESSQSHLWSRAHTGKRVRKPICRTAGELPFDAGGAHVDRIRHEGAPMLEWTRCPPYFLASVYVVPRISGYLPYHTNYHTTFVANHRASHAQ